jgi:uncharacterized protein
MVADRAPGVYREVTEPPTRAAVQTGVPAFLGYAEAVSAASAVQTQPVVSWDEFRVLYRRPQTAGHLHAAVRGFFENGGRSCYVLRLDERVPPLEAHEAGLQALAGLEAVDLVCAPDLVRRRQPGDFPPDPPEVREGQEMVIRHCDQLGDRFALLDAVPGAAPDDVVSQARWCPSPNAGLYYPWVGVREGRRRGDGPPVVFVPPCGHVAGVYATTDQRVGVHKAPANEALRGVLDLERPLTDAQQRELNPAGVNCLRSFPGRGIRVWGARTLSDHRVWTYVNARRVYLTLGRWIDGNLPGVAFEPHGPSLWAAITRELTGYLTDAFMRGALAGASPQEAFYVVCNEATNPPAVRDAGMVVTEVGIAATAPMEFVVVRITQDAQGARPDRQEEILPLAQAERTSNASG